MDYIVSINFTTWKSLKRILYMEQMICIFV